MQRRSVRKTRFLAAFVLCPVVVGAGCGGGANPSTKQVTRAQLALMVLPKSALVLPARVRLEHPVGFYSNAQSAASGINPRVTSASLSRDGRLTGYALGYSLSKSQSQDALLRGSGQINILTEVDLYRDTTGPATKMAQGISDLRALVGKPIKDGATLDRGAAFRVRGIGDAAAGLRFEVGYEGVHIYYTEVGFRYGRLLASVVDGRADPTNVDAAVISRAQALEERINGVLSGKIRGRGVSRWDSSAPPIRP